MQSPHSEIKRRVAERSKFHLPPANDRGLTLSFLNLVAHAGMPRIQHYVAILCASSVM
jgi:hypothetical protein